MMRNEDGKVHRHPPPPTSSTFYSLLSSHSSHLFPPFQPYNCNPNMDLYLPPGPLTILSSSYPPPPPPPPPPPTTTTTLRFYTFVFWVYLFAYCCSFSYICSISRIIPIYFMPMGIVFRFAPSHKRHMHPPPPV